MRNLRKSGPRKAVIGAILAFAAASAAGLSLSLAQTGETEEPAGAVVSLSGNGGDIGVYGASVTVDGEYARVRAAGAVVDIRGMVDGRIWAAGADVTVSAQTGGNVRAAGANVTLRGRISGDVTAAGALVDIDVASGGSLSAAGANVTIGALSDIDGDLKAAGANVDFDGRVGGDAKFAGAVVTFNGRADGDVTVRAQRLFIGPQAVISGDLTVRSIEAPEIAVGAEISGEQKFESLSSEVPFVEDLLDQFESLPKLPAPIYSVLALAAAAILAGLVFLIFARNTFGEAVDHIRYRPLSSVLYGIVSLLILIVLASLLIGSIVGLGLGFALLLLLPIILVLGYAVAVTGIVGWIFGRSVPRLGIGRLLAFLIVGALVIGLAGIIPFTGFGIVVFVLIFGVGALLRAVLWRFRQTRDSGPREVPAAAEEAVEESSGATSMLAVEEAIETSRAEESNDEVEVEEQTEKKEPPER